MMKDIFQILYEDVILKAKEEKVSRGDVIKYFLDSYERHKLQHGSFREHAEYNNAMRGRYQWMYDQTLKYIEELKNGK